MGRSSTSSKAAVKVSSKQQQEFLKYLGLDVSKIVSEGIEKYIASGTRVLLESLMQAEVQKVCGDWHSRGDNRDCVRWGSERGKAKTGGGNVTVTRPGIQAVART